MLSEEFKFLIDVNLPKRFSFFNKSNFHFVADLDPRMSDMQLWEYALNNNLVIVTKDTDFYNLSISSLKKPKVIYLQLGNIKISDLHKFFEKNWSDIISHLNDASMIIVQQNKIISIK
ncbi:DUF5615 family PIN-like protein [Ignavibacterium sp.]|uniref:DUF5615 family PIN-like protein n=1 Tax=Ignavibacterium sp. TaxID=2651167 RepID=UPI00220BAE3A|nr:DUF5615 family PIN-like protein [Ignavibacterium sp.]BDQ03596.1 MAG: hypothetical protein KatS3mg037_2171 [Ignavibacterium sp.]